MKLVIIINTIDRKSAKANINSFRQNQLYTSHYRTIFFVDVTAAYSNWKRMPNVSEDYMILLYDKLFNDSVGLKKKNQKIRYRESCFV